MHELREAMDAPGGCSRSKHRSVFDLDHRATYLYARAVLEQSSDASLRVRSGSVLSWTLSLRN